MINLILIRLILIEFDSVRFAQFRPPILALKPLFFQVPQQEPDPLFLGRSWLFREMAAHLIPERADQPTSRGVIVTGSSGSGKTAVALQLVENSCFGRPRPTASANTSAQPDNIYESPYGRSGRAMDGMQALASRVVAYHFCQADNSNTCLVADFVHSIAAQLCQAPQLVAYRQLLLSNPQLQGLLSLKECIANPHAAFVTGVLEPLAGIKRAGEDVNFRFFF